MSHLIARFANGSETYRNGQLIPQDNYVIVPKFRCAVVEIDGVASFDPTKGKSLFLLCHLSPNMIIGNSRIKSKEKTVIDDEVHFGYIVTTYYLVLDGIVYSRKGYEPITKDRVIEIVSQRGLKEGQYDDADFFLGSPAFLGDSDQDGTNATDVVNYSTSTGDISDPS